MRLYQPLERSLVEMTSPFTDKINFIKAVVQIQPWEPNLQPLLEKDSSMDRSYCLIKLSSCIVLPRLFLLGIMAACAFFCCRHFFLGSGMKPSVLPKLIEQLHM